MLISNEEEMTGLNSGDPTAEIPYSVSVPMTLGMAIRGPYRYWPALTRSTCRPSLSPSPSSVRT